jgi:hypothetical protein
MNTQELLYISPGTNKQDSRNLIAEMKPKLSKPLETPRGVCVP